MVRRELLLPVERATAWAMVGDPVGLAEWLADEVDLELREGATGELRWRSGERRRAVVEEVADLRRLVLRWWEPEGPASIVELTLDEVDGGTRLVVVEIPEQTLRVVGEQVVQDGLRATRRGVGGTPQMVVSACA